MRRGAVRRRTPLRPVCLCGSILFGLLVLVYLPATRARADGVDLEKAKAWWSFQPPREPAVPEVRGKEWAVSPVDRFVLAKLEAKGLSPSPPADKRTLIRRATFDLTGLPPTPSEVAAFLADESTDAFSKVVDRLLASPHYGERWGRHWLDVVRYADTAGDGADYPVREAYKYRDYVIRAFNADKPYDQFLREQVAGDLIAAKGQAAAAGAGGDAYADPIVATGFIAIGKRFGYNTNDAFKHLDVADTIEVLGRSVLGLSIGCARCHDHKYDPVTAADYYALYGIFAGTTYTFPGGEEHQRPEGLVPLVPPARRGAMEKEWKEKLAAFDARLKAAAEDKSEKSPEAKKEAAQALKKLKRERDDLAANPPYDAAYAVTESGKPANARIQLRGERHRLGDEVPRGFPKVLGGQTLPPDCKTSGRLELAGWLADKANPLTARVMVNRIWQHRFGRGIVKTASDFGTRGSPPTHPELLDWLALRFVEKGWSVKAMHREIMLSATYRQSSTDQPQHAASDPQNELLWKFSRRRLDAESIRDAMLLASGTLDTSPAGPHPFPPVSQWRFTIHNPFYAVYEHDRRSVYLMVQRQKRHPFLSLFDGPDPNVSTEERQTTVTPAQALYLMNDPFVHEKSAALAKRLLGEAADDGGRVRLAYELTCGREPDADELVRSGLFLGRYREKLASIGKPAQEQEAGAWGALARVLITSNAFLFVD